MPGLCSDAQYLYSITYQIIAGVHIELSRKLAGDGANTGSVMCGCKQSQWSNDRPLKALNESI